MPALFPCPSVQFQRLALPLPSWRNQTWAATLHSSGENMGCVGKEGNRGTLWPHPDHPAHSAIPWQLDQTMLVCHLSPNELWMLKSSKLQTIPDGFYSFPISTTTLGNQAALKLCKNINQYFLLDFWVLRASKALCEISIAPKKKTNKSHNEFSVLRSDPSTSFTKTSMNWNQKGNL